MSGPAPHMLVVAHGTASVAGLRTVEALALAAARCRPDVRVELCYLDVAQPTLLDALDERPTVVVPAFLSTGQHVQVDIPAAQYPATTVARHLGPHPLLADALAARLPEVGGREPVLLVAAGSTHPTAAEELAEQGRLLQRHLGLAVQTASLADDLTGPLSGAACVSTYLLAEGRFEELLRRQAGDVPVAGVLGAHPAIVALLWLRYDEALHAVR